MTARYSCSPPAIDPRVAIFQGLSSGRRPILARAALGAFLFVLGPTLLLPSHAAAQEWKTISPQESKIGFVGGPLAGAQPTFARTMKGIEHQGELAAFENAKATGLVVHLKLMMIGAYSGWTDPNAKRVINDFSYFQDNVFQEKSAGRASVNGFQSRYAVVNVEREGWSHDCVAFEMSRGDHFVRGFLCGTPNETMTKKLAVDWLTEIKIGGAIGP